MSPRLSVVPPPVTPAVSPAPGIEWGTWEHGRTRTVNGVTTFYLRKRIGGGVRREFAVASHSHAPTARAAALAEVALFNTNPLGYRPPKERTADAARGMQTGAVCLDAATLAEFSAYAKALVENGQMSERHQRYTLATYLPQWAAALGTSTDLHKVTLDDLQRALRTWKGVAQHKRVVALKSFTAWARTEKSAPKLRRREDPTLDLATPAVQAANKGRKKKKGYAVPFVENVYRHLDSQVARDMVRLRVHGNGMHDTEIRRLAEGEADLLVVDDPSGIYGVIEFPHLKKGADHAVSVDRATFEAARRLQARGAALSTSALHDALHAAAIAIHGCDGVQRVFVVKTGPQKGKRNTRREACKGCPLLHPSELRHSFATWSTTIGEEVTPANQKGINLDRVAEMMGHLNKRTTAVHYVGRRVPNMARIPIRLEHPDDPA